MRRGLTFEQFIEALCLVGVGFAACLMPAQSDTWWHLRTGQQTWLAGAVQLHDSYSYTAAGAYWPNHEWLSELLIYGLYRAGGLALVTAILASAIVATWAIVWSLTPGSVRWRCALCLSAVVASAPEWSLRPKVFTLLFLAITAFLLSRRRYTWLPLVFLVWANLHGGVLLGLIVLTAAVIARFMENGQLPVRDWLSVAGSFLAVSCTPLGFSFWIDITQSIGRIREYGIDEWKPPQLTNPVMAPFWAISGLLLIGIVYRRWRTPRESIDVLACGAAALLPLALMSTRNVSAALLLATPAAAALVGARDPVVRSGHRRMHGILLIGAVLVGGATIWRAWRSEIPRLQWHPLSQGATLALDSCADQLYNRYDDGGYLIWFSPSRKVFIDGRQDPYPPSLMLDHIRMEQTGDYQPTFKKYAIRCAFLPANSLVARHLQADGWVASYSDAQWVVLTGHARS